MRLTKALSLAMQMICPQSLAKCAEDGGGPGARCADVLPG
jgi:hypothetical protein